MYVSDLDFWAPVTKLYRLSGGQHVAITVLDFFTACGTEVFLCDERGVAIDADGDGSNGLTPILRLPAGTSYDVALQEAERVVS